MKDNLEEEEEKKRKNKLISNQKNLMTIRETNR
jgi:hypothetical protein